MIRRYYGGIDVSYHYEVIEVVKIIIVSYILSKNNNTCKQSAENNFSNQASMMLIIDKSGKIFKVGGNHNSNPFDLLNYDDNIFI